MKKNQIKKENHFFKALLIILILIFASGLLSFIIVFPLYKWASISPKSYTIIFLLAFFAFIAFTIVKKILSRKTDGKKKE